MAERKRPGAVLIPSLLFLLALGLRLLLLDGQSYWNDEGTSVALAKRSLLTITRDASHDIHPPFYYYLLHLWIKIFGESEVGVRSLSALLGATVVPLVYALARQLFDGRTALVAALLALVSPLGVYYSQEARMYILVTMLGAVSFLLLLRWLEHLVPTGEQEAKPGPRTPWAYVLATILMMYSHYFAFAIVVAQNLLFVARWLALWPRPGRGGERGANRAWPKRLLVAWLAAQLGILLAFLPWVAVVWKQLRNWPAVSEPIGLTDLLKRVLHAFSLGLTAEGAGRVSVLFGIIVILGWGIQLLQNVRGKRAASFWWGATTVGAYLTVPIAAMYVLSLQRPMYNAKFLLLATPAYALLLGKAMVLASGKAWFRVVWLATTFLGIVLPSAVSLRSYYQDPRYARDDYRGITTYIAAAEGSQDATVVNAPGQYETIALYYRGQSPVFPLPRQRPIDTTATEADLGEMIKGRERIYAILWATDESDPGRFIEGWLDSNTYKASDSWFGNVRLVVYAVPRADASDAPRVELDARFGDRVILRDYSLLTPDVQAGGILQIALAWESSAPIDERYKVFIHILNAHDRIVGQRDSEPGGGVRFTTTWQVGERIHDNHGVLVQPGTPPGSYRVAVGMYDASTGQRLPVKLGEQTAGDKLFLNAIRVIAPIAPPPRTALGMAKEVELGVGPLVLLGYNLAKLGQEHQPDAPVYPGDA